MRKVSVYLATFFIYTMIFGLNLALAQTQATTENNRSRKEQKAAENRFDNLLAQARTIRRAGFSPLAASTNGYIDAFGVKPLTQGGSLNVIGSGAIDVQGMIATTLGGLKFPNGTLQPASAGAQPLFSVTHDATLQGDGTSGFPLSITVPLTLNGSLTVNGVIQAAPSSGNGVEATGGAGKNGNGANGVNAIGGEGLTGPGGIGVLAQGGGGGTNSFGGIGVLSAGGNSVEASGGIGVRGNGGNSDKARGGVAVEASGGRSKSFVGGTGVEASGGASDSGTGGIALDVTGGSASGIVNVSGTGIVARAGTAFAGAEQGLSADLIGDAQVSGNFRISGNLTKGGGSFKIDHPLDPANKYLYHSFVESPDMMNIYNGNVTTDATGGASVELPQYFGALNRDFRYQLTVIGTFAQAIVAEKVNDNHFRIKTNLPNVEVSWQVTGIRQDAYANKNRIPVEQDKLERDRGFYLHPDAFDQPEEKGILMVQHPETSRQMKEAREKAQKEKSQ